MKFNFKILVLGALALGLWWYTQSVDQDRRELAQTLPIQEDFIPSKIGFISSRTPQSQPVLESFIVKEALRIGRVDEAPDQTQARLDEFAQNLGGEHFEVLTAFSLQSDRPMDERFLAVYLLSQCKNEKVLPYLYKISVASLNAKSGPHFEEELILRLQALNGLSRSESKSRTYLEKYIVQQNNFFLVTQARQLLGFKTL